MMTIPALYYNYNHVIEFSWEQVLTLEGEGNYTCISFSDGRQHCSTKSLCVYESHLPEAFVRVHKHCIVNVQFVKAYEKCSKELLLANGQIVQVSRRKNRLIKKQLKPFITKTPKCSYNPKKPI